MGETGGEFGIRKGGSVMTLGGWINLIVSVGSVTVLFVWCLYKVLSHNPPEQNPVDQVLDAHDEK